ncbi:MAG: Hsp33 family molecular chaperone HslO [Alphaproteobacteria bacterium]
MRIERSDFLLPFQLKELGIRGRLVRLGTVADQVVAGHGYPDEVGGLLSQSLALTAVMAGALKYDGVFSLQTKGDGPVSMIVADVTSEGEMRGYASFDAARLHGTAESGAHRAGTVLRSVPKLLGAGYLAFTVDQGPDTERYQGIVELAGATLADCARQYLRQSEQIAAGLHVAASKNGNGHDRAHWRAGAMMLQRLPSAGGPEPGEAGADDEETDDHWRRACILLASLTDRELLSPDLTPERLLLRLFPEDSVTVFESRPLVHRCRCSRQRVERALAAIPFDELSSLQIDGRIEVRCQFCNAAYEFDETDLEDLPQM